MIAAGVILLLGRSSKATAGRYDAQPDKVIISCQRRRGKPSWELPKGGVKFHGSESLEAAAIRELREETGVANELGSLLPLHHHEHSKVHWFLAHLSEGADLLWQPIADRDTLDARCVELEEADRILREDHRHLLASVVGDLKHGRLRWQ